VSRRLAGLPRVLGLVLVALAAAGCMPSAATEEGRQVDILYAIFMAVAAVVALIVWGGTSLEVLRFRRRGRPAGLPRQIHGSMRLELTWTVLPLITVIVLFILTVGVMNVVLARSDAPAATVSVTAFRWGWQFDYGDGVRVVGDQTSPPTLVVPAGKPVAMTITSADVDHAFFVPAFLFKRDAIPGLTSHFDFTVSQPGTYAGQCAEFCGVFHAQMLFTVQAISASDFQTWLAAQPRSSP
jgi:cytochrome c oxidase subunit 2